MRLRPLALADLEAVRLLRNQHREFFFDSREIDRDQQLAWFARLSTRPVAFYVIEEDGRVAGTVSVTRQAGGQEIGNQLLAAEYRGRGLMRAAVAQLAASPGHYYAAVKPGNTASLNVFRALGFAEEPAGDTIVLRKEVNETPSRDHSTE